MNLDNPVESIMHYLLSEGMTYLSCRDKFSKVSALVRMVAH